MDIPSRRKKARGTQRAAWWLSWGTMARRAMCPSQIIPEVPEAGGRKLGVANGVMNVLVPEVVL
jgi:hypothetical protein